MQGDTISAIATAQGEGGIGIIRLSGQQAITIATRMFRPVSGKSLNEYESHRAVYGNIIDEEKQIVDEALALIMKAPHSYTREDVVEFQCHGGIMPLRKTLALTYRYGARPAEGGEFTKRAFLNGRLDLSQAQAVMDIITAKTDRSLKMAAGHLSGQFSQQIKHYRQEILGQIAHLEAAIDFPEDEVDDVVTENVAGKVVDIRNNIAVLLKTAGTGRILRDGLMTAIVGKPNVGKSSLLNALLQEERAIVTDIPGTTRDSIEEYANVGGVLLRIIDTAGIRATKDVVERIGVEKARQMICDAALVLALFDGSRPLDAEDAEILSLLNGQNALLLLNKSDLQSVVRAKDLAEKVHLPVIEISTKNSSGLDKLAQAIQDKVYGGKVACDEGSFVRDERQAELLRQADNHLEEALNTIEAGLGLDFISIDLRSAWEKLGEITGDTVGEDIIDEIFSKFCIGK
ncbi:MAG: tRNA uridine-5-carboxymethylaminomethyl(34) synthesis GTPase MnmE [Selenomonas sp.]|uniref:tRNA uridine-5-carboxymethylaminomethyl(34) synthesis GTPase MnmE n=1 Tax=Selenomonas sp. TaxID=2053611 RepID=UPI0025FB6B18|nr:tRNA uridine-5-carboxymethylaminomethyl(34) synthesis GTPase MnmE [Selenomonas sp.]MCR5758314.1 tRNA uridine-5-carboxymethylaminomethyl(34) synthesis GTPase MnmE [Selenomonas sp.]